MPALSDSFEPLLRLLVLACRTGSFLAMSPLIRRLPVPPLAAVGLTLLVAVVLLVAGHGPEGPIAADWSLVPVIAREVAIGLVLGLLTLVAFEGFRLAGQIVGLAMGMAAATLLDPGERSQTSALSVAFGMFTALLFVLMDGHHMLLRMLAVSYALAPAGSAQFPAGAGQALVALLALSFALGFKIAAPVLAGQMLIDMTSGILGRSMPRMPVFFVALPVKILLSYGVTVLALPLLSSAVDSQIAVLERYLHAAIRGM